jgi:hypothetical protein
VFIGSHPKSAVIAFWKDAYLGVKDDNSQERVVASERKWHVIAARSSFSGVMAFQMPPTRYMMAALDMDLLREAEKLCKRA